ncbi:ZIP family metal transporter [Bermanella sp. WJH001]|uniref:ZIP family metal transporter n=1 Tax=Bermanella sp. WJH001 TaxID=3048005 RepID=UPI0024BDBF4E|nr:divalent cation transporter [Bermanella sp. WJH001]MDJ1538010.1 divalent cation transporter [Bermanella sp. WJH001]
MLDLQSMLMLTALAGLAMPLGALLAKFERLQSDWLETELRHGIIAFAAGALLSAIALVLVPEGIKHLSAFWACTTFIAGGLGFMLVDAALAKWNTPGSQLAAMLADFIPESLALGALFSIAGSNAVLLALLIGLQNLPEGFNAYREMMDKGHFAANKLIVLFVALASLGPISGFIGYYWLAQQPQLLSGIMLFAAGGIMYSIFQDIAPNVPLKQHRFPPMWALLGFVLGLLGHMLNT